MEEEEEGCYSNTGTIDVTDKKCPKTDEVCCKNPNFRATKCPKLIKKDEGEPKGPVTGRDPERPENWETCGRNGTGGLILTGTDDLATAQPGEFPHMCVIYRSVCLPLAASAHSPPAQDHLRTESLRRRSFSHCSKQAADCGPQVLGRVSRKINKACGKNSLQEQGRDHGPEGQDQPRQH